MLYSYLFHSFSARGNTTEKEYIILVTGWSGAPGQGEVTIMPISNTGNHRFSVMSHASGAVSDLLNMFELGNTREEKRAEIATFK